MISNPEDIDLSSYKELFLNEAQTLLTTLRHNVTRLGEDPADSRARGEAHRAAHTLKSMAATMRYDDLTAIARGLEDPFLSELPLTPDQIDFIVANCSEFETGLQQLAKDTKDDTRKRR